MSSRKAGCVVWPGCYRGDSAYDLLDERCENADVLIALLRVCMLSTAAMVEHVHRQNVSVWVLPCQGGTPSEVLKNNATTLNTVDGERGGPFE